MERLEPRTVLSCTTPAVGPECVDVPVQEQQEVARVSHNGEVDPCEDGGHSIGFWANRHGQDLIESNLASSLTLLNLLHLRDADGSDAEFASAEDVRSFLRSANARNMATMLSAQMAAMALNVRFGFVSDTAVVDAAGAMSADAFGQATVADLLNEANASLAANGLTRPPNPERDYQELLKDIFDEANNDPDLTDDASCPDDQVPPDDDNGPPDDVPNGNGPPPDVPRGKGRPEDGPPGHGGTKMPQQNGPPEFVREMLFANPGFLRAAARSNGRFSRL